MLVGGRLSGQWVKRQYRRDSSTRSLDKVCSSSAVCLLDENFSQVVASCENFSVVLRQQNN